MKYNTDKRTKNLTLRDIHVGDWVQVWRPLPKEYTPPMKVSSIHYDGTVYLVSDDEGHCNPYEANIKDIDALPIDADLLRGFGFEIETSSNDENKIRYSGNFITFLREEYEIGKDCIGTLCDIKTGRYRALHFFYMHEFIAYVEEILGVKIEWKGIEK